MAEAFICDTVRVPSSRYGGALATVRADNLAAFPINALLARNSSADWMAIDKLVYGCAQNCANRGKHADL